MRRESRPFIPARLRAALLMVGAVALGSCARAPQRHAERLAVLPFDNLTGDASLDWISPAAQAMLSDELSGSAVVTPLRAASASEAYDQRATHFLHTTFARSPTAGDPNRLRFEYEVEDAGRHKMIEASEVDGSMSAIGEIARRLDAAAQPLPTSNADALAAWGHGDFEQAVMLDPDFGAAWIALIQKLASGGAREDAASAAQKALSRASLHGEAQRAQIQLLLAALRNDPAARAAALNAIVRSVPGDAASRTALAQIEARARHYEESARLYHEALDIDPANADIMNQLGYAEGLTGRVSEARAALEQYSKQPGQSVNALDSLGEVHFLNGRFKDAAGYFNKAYAANPNFLGGVTILKAAYAEWLGGNLAGADATIGPVFAAMAARGDPAAEWRQACWLYATGRKDQAIAKLMSATPRPQNKELIERQLAVWNGQAAPPRDLARLKMLYESAQPTGDGMVRTFYAAALAAAGRKDEATALVQQWPLPEQGEPLFQSLVYPQFIELRRSLGVK